MHNFCVFGRERDNSYDTDYCLVRLFPTFKICNRNRNASVRCCNSWSYVVALNCTAPCIVWNLAVLSLTAWSAVQNTAKLPYYSCILYCILYWFSSCTVDFGIDYYGALQHDVVSLHNSPLQSLLCNCYFKCKLRAQFICYKTIQCVVHVQ